MKVMPNPTPRQGLIWGIFTGVIGIVVVCYLLATPIGKLGGDWNDVEVFEPYKGTGAFAPFPKAQAPAVTAMPRLEVDERAYIQEYWAEKGGELYTYGWVDKPKGILHVPIYRAMEQVLEDGLPYRADKGEGK